MYENKSIFFWTNYYYNHPEIGTTPKILSEIKTLRKMGFSVYYTAYLDDGVGVFDNQDEIILKKSFIIRNKFYLKAFRKDYLINIARQFIKYNKFDYFLLRINSISNSYYRMLKEMKKQGAFVMMESLSYYPNMDFGKYKKASYHFISKSLKKHKDDLKFVVDLMLTEGRLDDFYGIPCVEFGMGIDVDRYNEHKYIGDKDELNLLMVGCDSVYHGTDRVVSSVINFTNNFPNKKIRLHLVGDILDKDMRLIKESNLSNVIICYGKKSGKELDDIFDQCNIALGPLAQHRIQKKDTGLKTKEYFARGIPYIYTGEEFKIDSDYPYILKIDDSEQLIDINSIFEFYLKIRNDDRVIQTMRNTAKLVFSWDEIFKNVFETAANC